MIYSSKYIIHTHYAYIVHADVIECADASDYTCILLHVQHHDGNQNFNYNIGLMLWLKAHLLITPSREIEKIDRTKFSLELFFLT